MQAYNNTANIINLRAVEDTATKINKKTPVKIRLGERFEDFMNDIKDPNMKSTMIAKKYNVSYATVGNYRMDEAYPVRTATGKVSAAARKEFLIAANNGEKLTHIAKRFNVRTSTVVYHLRKQGYYRNKQLKALEAENQKAAETVQTLTEEVRNDIAAVQNELSAVREDVKTYKSITNTLLSLVRNVTNNANKKIRRGLFGKLAKRNLA